MSYTLTIEKEFDSKWSAFLYLTISKDVLLILQDNSIVEIEDAGYYILEYKNIEHLAEETGMSLTAIIDMYEKDNKYLELVQEKYPEVKTLLWAEMQ